MWNVHTKLTCLLSLAKWWIMMKIKKNVKQHPMRKQTRTATALSGKKCQNFKLVHDDDQTNKYTTTVPYRKTWFFKIGHKKISRNSKIGQISKNSLDKIMKVNWLIHSHHHHHRLKWLNFFPIRQKWKKITTIVSFTNKPRISLFLYNNDIVLCLPPTNKQTK